MKRRAQPWLGTVVEITVADRLDDAALNLAFGCAFDAIATVHRLMSFHDPDSDVSRINRAAPGSALDIDPQTAFVLHAALALAQQSDNLFNPFCAPRLVEWGYLPAPAEPAPDWDVPHSALVLDGCRVLKRAAAWIDLGGIAKGHAVDAAVTALQHCGILSACVNAGGDLRVIGAEAWPVQLRDPRHPTAAAYATTLCNAALATSAIYFSCMERVGHMRSALVHGRDGEPLLRNASVSVAAPSCMMADALTKVVAVSGDVRHSALQAHHASAFIC
jgi:thiamine biosynthesis lipoprotein